MCLRETGSVDPTEGTACASEMPSVDPLRGRRVCARSGAPQQLCSGRGLPHPGRAGGAAGCSY